MNFGMFGVGAVLAFAAMGSALGIGAAGMAATGAWKKCYAQNRPAPFLLVAFVGAPLSQTIYGFIVMQRMVSVMTDPSKQWLLLGAGVLGGIAIGMSAMFQGRIGAVASDALGETGKGFGNYIIAIGVVETVALFVMVFILGIL